MKFPYNGIAIPEILLPGPDVDLSKWAVVACDQYTSQREYWAEVARKTQGAPSALNIIYPEAWLDQGDGRIEEINRAMAEYERDVLTQRVNGFVLVERTTQSGSRLGLMAAVDLEAYDFYPGSVSQIRATEGTVLSRIPPRVKIRKNAPLESPHIMLLVDDVHDLLIRPLYEDRGRMELLYDVNLMMEGGRLRGWRVDADIHLESVQQALYYLNRLNPDLLFAVGDGNHSLATARQCWLELKESLTEEQQLTHPARYALAEIVNLHDPALVFEPIHRLLRHVDGKGMIFKLNEWCGHRGLKLKPCMDGRGDCLLTYVDEDGKLPLAIDGAPGELTVSLLQPFLDNWLLSHSECEIDYIHGEQALRSLAAKPGCCGFLLTAMDKKLLFPSVKAHGALPRKTFSMGEANEKRYYMECRRLHR
jgi:hypothetical protein